MMSKTKPMAVHVRWFACVVAVVLAICAVPAGAFAQDDAVVTLDAESEITVVAQGDQSFKDVNSSTPHVNDILWLASTGITRGYSDGTFRPTGNVKRADMAAFLYRLADRWNMIPSGWEPSQLNMFADVNQQTPHYKEILWLAENGISTGWLKDGVRTFRPSADVVRQDMAAFLFRLAQRKGIGDASANWTASDYTRGRFIDVDPDVATNHHREVWWLAQKGISQGWPLGDGKYEFRGLKPILRQDMAAFIHRLDNLRDDSVLTPEIPI